MRLSILRLKNLSGELTRRPLAVLAVFASVAAASGCGSRPAASASTETPRNDMAVKVVRPAPKDFDRIIEQPGRIEAFEQAPLFSKIAGYVKKVNVEIGAQVKEGQVLAELSVPELEKELLQKTASVEQATNEIEQARQTALAAEASYETAQSLVKEAEAAAKRAEAVHDRWQSQYASIEKLTRNKVLDEQARDETLNQLQAATADLELMRAKINSAKANQKESRAKADKAAADVRVSQSHLQVAKAEQQRAEALLAYTTIRAPFEGVVSERHVDPGHFLQPGMSGGANKAEPLFIVVKTDVVRVFVDVPESDAMWIKEGAKAQIRVQSLQDEDFEGMVAGSSWSLDPNQRTLRTEIDLPNPDRRLRPGMYAYARLPLHRSGVLSLPASAVVIRDGQSCCFCADGGKAVCVPVRTGTRHAGFVEIVKKNCLGEGGKSRWLDFTGSENIVSTDVLKLTDGQSIQVED